MRVWVMNEKFESNVQYTLVWRDKLESADQRIKIDSQMFSHKRFCVRIFSQWSDKTSTMVFLGLEASERG